MSQRYYTCPTATLMDSYARRICLSGPTASTLSGRGRDKARHRRPSPPPCSPTLPQAIRGDFCVILIHFISLNYIMESPRVTLSCYQNRDW